ncbi:helix-turn-helix domain-containing protein [Streptomyces sp. NPDC086023]|uniref:helix-turn-helix domain-containing protein n=1 Tax=Streptomyces sp. NPDC086023 TaxID=3365746 RepID=UPI0037D60C6F
MLSQDPLDRLKRRLRVLRTSRGLSMAGLELRAGLGHTTVSQALNGPSVPSEQTVVALADALGIPAEPLLALRAEALPGQAPPRLRSRPPTRFTYEYLEQRSLPLLRGLHATGAVPRLAAVRIRTVDLHLSRVAGDPALPDLCAAYTHECLRYTDAVENAADLADFALLAATATLYVKGDRKVDVYAGAIALIDKHGVDSVVFLSVQGDVDCATGGSAEPPWRAWTGIRDLLEREGLPWR